MPKVVRLLGRYDVWDLEDPDVLKFQMGMRYRNYDLNDKFWNEMLSVVEDSLSEFIANDKIKGIIKGGELIIEWEDIKSKEYCKSYGIETFLNGHRAIAVNIGRANSQFFQSYFDPKDYELFIYFCRLQTNRWTVGVISNREDIHAGNICKSYGGGGHAGIGGFQIEELPFEI